MAFAERVSAGDQRDRLLIVHRHPSEGLANIPSRGSRIGLSIWSFGIHVDQAHLNCRKRLFQLTITGVAFIPQPLALGAPVNLLLWLPNVFTSARETKGFESH